MGTSRFTLYVTNRIGILCSDVFNDPLIVDTSMCGDFMYDDPDDFVEVGYVTI